MLVTRSLGFVILNALLIGSAHAEPGPRRVLPLTGLEVELRDRATHRYVVSSSFALDDGARTFDGRDVIDEHEGDALVAGTWAHVGWLVDGRCAAALRAVPIEPAWEVEDLPLWGTRVSARGGTFTFEGELGRKPAVAVCVERAARKQLLVYHFLLTPDATTEKGPMLHSLARGSVPEKIYRAWRADRTAPVAPRTLATVRDRSPAPVPDTLRLGVTGLLVRMPADGFVWLRDDSIPGVDRLDRMAPALPELTLELAVSSVATCDEAFAALDGTRRRAPLRGVPEWWVVGPVLALEDGSLEDTLCRPFDWGVALVGVMSTPRSSDLGSIGALLAALTDAARASVPEGRAAPRELRLGRKALGTMTGARAENTDGP